MTDGNCDYCGSPLFITGYLRDDGRAEFAVVCPNCDQIPPPDDLITPDDPDDD